MLVLLILDVEQYANTIPTLSTSNERCRSARSCPGSSTVTWCIHLYHPTEKVEICLDKNGVINVTDYAHLLLLECFYSVEVVIPISSYLFSFFSHFLSLYIDMLRFLSRMS